MMNPTTERRKPVRTMATVAKILEAKGIEITDEFYVKVENPPYMALVIEGVGRSPNGNVMVSVAHYFEQNRDLCRDPEMVFEATADDWLPVVFQQDIPLYVCRSIAWEDGGTLIHPKALRDNKSFARTWDRNLKEQGFLDVAKAVTNG